MNISNKRKRRWNQRQRGIHKITGTALSIVCWGESGKWFTLEDKTNYDNKE